MDSADHLNLSEIKIFLRKMRDDNERKSFDLIQLWENYLVGKLSKFDNEKYLVLEQVFLAALDCGLWDIAENCLGTMQADFPQSNRVEKYKVMLLEGLGRYDDALDVLDVLIKNDETNAAPRKRKVTILKAKNKIPEAIKELCDYLKRFMSDQEAWNELCNLYLMENDYQKALFCMEELLLHNPHSHLYNQKLADIRFTMGGIENYEIAKQYYAQAIKLNQNNLRAVYGLYLCGVHISNSKATTQRRKESQKTTQWALEKILDIHKSHKKSNVEKLRSAFGALEVKGTLN